MAISYFYWQSCFSFFGRTDLCSGGLQVHVGVQVLETGLTQAQVESKSGIRRPRDIVTAMASSDESGSDHEFDPNNVNLHEFDPNNVNIQPFGSDEEDGDEGEALFIFGDDDEYVESTDSDRGSNEDPIEPLPLEDQQMVLAFLAEMEWAHFSSEESEESGIGGELIFSDEEPEQEPDQPEEVLEPEEAEDAQDDEDAQAESVPQVQEVPEHQAVNAGSTEEDAPQVAAGSSDSANMPVDLQNNCNKMCVGDTSTAGCQDAPQVAAGASDSAANTPGEQTNQNNVRGGASGNTSTVGSQDGGGAEKRGPDSSGEPIQPTKKSRLE